MPRHETHGPPLIYNIVYCSSSSSSICFTIEVQQCLLILFSHMKTTMLYKRRRKPIFTNRRRTLTLEMRQKWMNKIKTNTRRNWWQLGHLLAGSAEKVQDVAELVASVLVAQKIMIKSINRHCGVDIMSSFSPTSPRRTVALMFRSLLVGRESNLLQKRTHTHTPSPSDSNTCWAGTAYSLAPHWLSGAAN